MGKKRARDGPSTATACDDAVVPEKHPRKSADGLLFLPISFNPEERTVRGYLAGSVKPHVVHVRNKVCIRLHHMGRGQPSYEDFCRQHTILETYKAIYPDDPLKRKGLTANYVIREHSADPHSRGDEPLTFAQELADADVRFGEWCELPKAGATYVETVFDLCVPDPTELELPPKPRPEVGFMTVGVDKDTSELTSIGIALRGTMFVVNGKTTNEVFSKFDSKSAAMERVDVWIVWSKDALADLDFVVLFFRTKMRGVPIVTAYKIADSQDHSLRDLFMLEAEIVSHHDQMCNAQFLMKKLMDAYVPVAIELMMVSNLDIVSVLRPERTNRICEAMFGKALRERGYRRIRSAESTAAPQAVKGGKVLPAAANTLRVPRFLSHSGPLITQLDIVSSYPSAVIELQLCTNKGQYQHDHARFLPELMSSLLARRREAQAAALSDLPENRVTHTAIAAAVKTVSAAICGALGNKHCLHYDPALLNTITEQGRFAMNEMVNGAVGIAGNSMLHGVTDSVMFPRESIEDDTIKDMIAQFEGKFKHTKLTQSGFHAVAIFSNTSYAALRYEYPETKEGGFQVKAVVVTAGLLPNKRECPVAVAEACRDGFLGSWLRGATLDVAYDWALSMLTETTSKPGHIGKFICTKPPRDQALRAEHMACDAELGRRNLMHEVGTSFAYVITEAGVSGRVAPLSVTLSRSSTLTVDVGAYAELFIAPFALDVAERFGLEFTRVKSCNRTSSGHDGQVSSSSAAVRQRFPIVSSEWSSDSPAERVELSMGDLMF